MQSQRFFLHAAGVLTVCLFSVSAHANLNGIAQRSGKQGGAQTCMAAGCHNVNPSAETPTVELTGPTTLEAGATGNYTLIIRGGAAVQGGMNVAVSNNGGTLNPGAGLKTLAGEVTHTAPKNFTNNEVRFDFTLVAPAAAGTSKLFASGNSTNGNGSNDGDRSASTTLDVQITGGSQPDAGMPDGGTDPGKGEDDGGCSAAGGAPLLALLALIAAVGLGRRVV
jgi:uncharacterized protein (TIGR03382 family)